VTYWTRVDEVEDVGMDQAVYRYLHGFSCDSYILTGVVGYVESVSESVVDLIGRIFF
jgi:hypothetical protein